MNNPFLQIIKHRCFITVIWIVLFISGSICSANNNLNYMNETDSIRKAVDACITDSCKVSVLSKVFWQHENNDFEHAKYYGEWIYNEFKNSKNYYTLWQVSYIKGEILRIEEKFDSAYFFYAMALDISEKAGHKFRLAPVYFYLGEVNDAIGNHDDAINCMKTSLALFEKEKKWNDAHWAARKVAEMYARSAQYDSAEAYYSKRLALTKKTPDKTEL